MKQDELSKFFDDYMKKESLFSNKKALQANYSPDTIPHRDNQIKHVADILAPALRSEKPSNLFVYGKTGTGKTCVVKHVINTLSNLGLSKGMHLKIMYMNCKLKKSADTEYRLVAQLANELDEEAVKQARGGKALPVTGLPTDEIYKIFHTVLDLKEQLVVIVLDEIDYLIKKAGDDVLYNLTRINAEFKKAQLSIVGISNDLMFSDSLDPRVKSSLSEEEIVFPPYNAIQIQDILRQRADLSFKESTLSAGVIEKCAAYSAREHGDARRALELLRVAGEIAERRGQTEVTISHIDEAEDKIEHDRVLDVVLTQPKQHQLTLFSIFSIFTKGDSRHIFTGEIYERYQEQCGKVGINPLTQRRVSDIIAEMDMLGIINAKVVSKGRYGRTKEVSIPLPKSTLGQLMKILEEGLGNL